MTEAEFDAILAKADALKAKSDRVDKFISPAFYVSIACSMIGMITGYGEFSATGFTIIVLVSPLACYNVYLMWKSIRILKGALRELK